MTDRKFFLLDTCKNRCASAAHTSNIESGCAAFLNITPCAKPTNEVMIMCDLNLTSVENCTKLSSWEFCGLRGAAACAAGHCQRKVFWGLQIFSTCRDSEKYGMPGSTLWSGHRRWVSNLWARVPLGKPFGQSLTTCKLYIHSLIFKAPCLERWILFCWNCEGWVKMELEACWKGQCDTCNVNYMQVSSGN